MTTLEMDYKRKKFHGWINLSLKEKFNINDNDREMERLVYK